MKKQKALVTTQPGHIVHTRALTEAGQAANEAAARHVFNDHIARKAANTERRKRGDLALFENFLQSKGVPAAGLFDDPEAWRGVTWGLVTVFRDWQSGQGYATASINSRLSTVRTYAANLAAKTGAISDEEARLIGSVRGYDHKEAKHLDERRRNAGIDTRKMVNGKARKKAESVTIPEDIAEQLKQQSDTQQGQRDALLMCLLLDHGLRGSEIAILTRQAFDLKAGTLTFYRPKVNKTQTHAMTPATRERARDYLRLAPAEGIIWRKSYKGKAKLSTQMSEKSATRALTKRVELLGRHHGLESLSAHDGRHFAANFEAGRGTPIDRITQMFGWNSYAMAKRYIGEKAISNEGSARLKSAS